MRTSSEMQPLRSSGFSESWSKRVGPRGALWLLGLALIGCGSTGTVTDSSTGGACARVVANGRDAPVAPPDGASECPAGTCNYQSQTGCSATQACRPSFTDAKPACDTAGTGVSNTMCSAQADCAQGYYCVENQCHKLCCGRDWSACPAGESCIRDLQVSVGGQNLESGSGLCYPVNNCDPLKADGCPAGHECKIVDPQGSVACAVTSQAQEGDACSAPNFCAQGLICVEVDSGGATSPVCRKLCQAEMCGVPACSASEGTCVHFNRDPLGVGECTPGWPD
jgi:hypothetical protein